jgi:P-type Cu+ transporter
MAVNTSNKTLCFHCGEECFAAKTQSDEEVFCCAGCRMVYQLLNQKGLCDYYKLNAGPGTSQRKRLRKDKFAFLDNDNISQKIISFQDQSQTHVTFYLPQIHCSSCLYLLEHLHKLHPGVIQSKVNFPKKETAIIFNQKEISIRQIAELLSEIGYEPHISMHELNLSKHPVNKRLVYQLGVAAFCFGNVMLLSFPEYLGLESSEKAMQNLFRIFSLGLSLPVFLYCAQPFYISAWKSLRHNFLNIDAPIALAIIITFVRSAYAVLINHSAGYFDSLTGIVFFMLVGRLVQDKTYRQLSFERDYTSYFPLAVTQLQGDKEISIQLPEIRPGMTLLLHHDELIPADGILTRGWALIDYSFVTGESLPVLKEVGEIVYAGGKQTATNIEVLVVKEVAQSYLTELWNRYDSKNEQPNKSNSFVHLLSRYFTYGVLLIALGGAVYWWFHDTNRIWNVVTAVLIIACPCALLLSSTFTKGNILRILSRNHFYLKDGQTIENIAGINHIVLDKTGTLTSPGENILKYEGIPLSPIQEHCFGILLAQSAHPLSRALSMSLNHATDQEVDEFQENSGKGITGLVRGSRLAAGSKEWITGLAPSRDEPTAVYLSWENRLLGHYVFYNRYRDHAEDLFQQLRTHYRLSVVSGDNSGERENLQKLMGDQTYLLFNQGPADKLRYITHLQELGDNTLMVGDGLNDAGALRQSNAGIAVAADINNFTPASDAILEANQLPKLGRLIRLCKASRQIIIGAFVLSFIYNAVGIFFALQGSLSPIIAAILMPASSLSVLLISFGCSNLVAKWLRL